jgi:hypothetical protein
MDDVEAVVLETAGTFAVVQGTSIGPATALRGVRGATPDATKSDGH